MRHGGTAVVPFDGIRGVLPNGVIGLRARTGSLGHPERREGWDVCVFEALRIKTLQARGCAGAKRLGG